MRLIRGCVALTGALLLGGLAGPAAAADDECAAMNYLLAQARTEFPALRRSKVSAGHCSMARREYRCEWGFPSDRFDAAKMQGARLTRCTAAQPTAKPLEGKGDEVAFQLNPETSVHIRGPVMDSGEWTLTLRVISTADWN